jgi:hypothetical protein
LAWTNRVNLSIRAFLPDFQTIVAQRVGQRRRGFSGEAVGEKSWRWGLWTVETPKNPLLLFTSDIYVVIAFLADQIEGLIKPKQKEIVSYQMKRKALRPHSPRKDLSLRRRLPGAELVGILTRCCAPSPREGMMPSPEMTATMGFYHTS